MAKNLKQLLILVFIYVVVLVGCYYFIPLDNEEELIVNVSNEDVLMEDYVARVVASEMPASFELEALKAQCVAVRSYAIARNLNVDATTNTQVYKSEDVLRKEWQEDFDYYYNRIKQAANETKHEVMYYDGEVISAFYFAASNGTTSIASEYFQEDLPYIQSVSSEWDLEEYSGAKVTTSFSQAKLKEIFKTTNKVEIKVIDRYSTNRVKSVSVNNEIYSGKEFRELLNLRSSDFKVYANTNGYEIETVGYGHGVGMSQYGANALAKQGYSYQDILKYYYKDIIIKQLDV